MARLVWDNGPTRYSHIVWLDTGEPICLGERRMQFVTFESMDLSEPMCTTCSYLIKGWNEIDAIAEWIEERLDL